MILGVKPMNIRKNINYRDMYAALNHAMASEMEQMELYCAIGKAVSCAPKKVPLSRRRNTWPRTIRMLMVSLPEMSAECGISTVPMKTILLC